MNSSSQAASVSEGKLRTARPGRHRSPATSVNEKTTTVSFVGVGLGIVRAIMHLDKMNG